MPDRVGPTFGDSRDIRVLDRYREPTELVEMALTANGRVAPDTGYRYCNTDYAYEAWAAEPARSSQVDLQLGRIRR